MISPTSISPTSMSPTSMSPTAPTRVSLRRFLLGSVVLAALFWPLVSAFGHARSHSFSHWQSDGNEAQVTFWVAELEALRLEGAPEPGSELEAWMAERLRTGLDLRVGDGLCSPEPWAPVPAAAGFLRWTSRFRCEADLSEQAQLTVNLFLGELPDHLHFAKIETPGDGAGLQERILSADAPEASFQTASRSSVFVQYLILGVEHILIGLDHLAFVAALLLLCRSAKEILWLVTGFTVGHSLTLSLAVLDWVEPDIPVVEAFIGFTIALVTAEYVAARSARHHDVARVFAVGFGVLLLGRLNGFPGLPWLVLGGLAIFSYAYLHWIEDPEKALKIRPALTLCFGLVHGFGFASVLLDLGLAPGRLALSLFGFNLGVEIGQLLVVAVLILLTRPLARYPERLRTVLDLTAIALCYLGIFWFIERSQGLG